MGLSSRGFLLVFALLLLCVTLNAQIVSDFATDAESWTAPNSLTGVVTYNTTGGNPGGNISASSFSIVTGAGTIYAHAFQAPAKFLGNRNTYYDGTLRYDVRQSAAVPSFVVSEVIMTNNAGVSLWYYPSTPFASNTSWTTFSIRLNDDTGFWKTTNSATGPPATEAQIRAVLSNLVTLEIYATHRTGGGSGPGFLDNVTLMPPVNITTQPSSATVCEGVTQTFNAVAINNPNITYRWQRQTSPAVWTDVNNGGPFSGATTGTLAVSTAGNLTAAGTYRCRISGFAIDDVFTNTANLVINTFSSPPPVTPGSSCGPGTVALSASGASPGQYLWYTTSTGGAPIAGQTNSTFTTPVLSVTTPFYVAVTNGTCVTGRSTVTATINNVPGSPTTSGSASCGPATLTLTANGASPGQYRWYTVASGGTAIAGELNASYTTPVITATTTYHVAINNGCEGARTAVVATINTPPTAPTTTGTSSCVPGSFTLSAAGGLPGQYRWYTLSTGGTPIAGQTNDVYQTPPLSFTTSYYVEINNGTCVSARTAVTATISNPIAPGVTGGSACMPAAIALTASGGNAGQYRWYTTPSGGTAIVGETSHLFVTPELSNTTTYYVALNNGCEGPRTGVVATIHTPPNAPTTNSGFGCIPSTVVLSAAGGLPGQYRWYTSSTGGLSVSGQINSTFGTPILDTTTTYYVSINNGTCESTRAAVVATLTAIPAAPTTTNAISCSPGSVTLRASGGMVGQYRWYSSATGGPPFQGQTFDSFTTPVLAISTTYFVAVNVNGCESPRTAVTASISPPGCATNRPPEMEPSTVSTEIGGAVTLDLQTLITDSDANIDLSSITILSQPSSGAVASIDGNFNLVVDYNGNKFAGTETVTIRACDVYSSCVQQVVTIVVFGDIKIYNAVSPNNDGKNDILLIEHIVELEQTRRNRVTIYNRWGDLVWEGTNYNNGSVAFSGKTNGNDLLPSGTYYYKIEFTSGKKTVTGYLALKH